MMQLPSAVLALIHRLEEGGYPCYAVGGCVRDWLLGLRPHDYDLCTSATPAEMKALFADYGQVLAGEKHGTVGIITHGGVVEITTFRTEGDYADNRHPDRVEFVDAIEEDLARRDFTVNAMAWSPIRGLCDPFGGKKDLENRVLRAVGDPRKRFREDSLRILRAVRFSARFRLEPEERTLRAMFELVDLTENLARERVFDELCKLLVCCTAQDLLRFEPILTRVIPELKPCVGFLQHTRHHLYDVYTHTAQVVEATAPILALRWAALLHDVGKPETFTLDGEGNGHFYGHAAIGAEKADGILRRLKAPTALRTQVAELVRYHMDYPEPTAKPLRRRLSRLGAENLDLLLQLQEADTGGKGLDHEEDLRYFNAARVVFDQLLEEKACLKVTDLAVNGHDLMALGFRGQAIGRILNELLELVIDERLSNDRAALLEHLKNQ
ncbi:MAG: CCA tRNA nucleotidyltransferase [Ruminococcaceae bacterium]|nr:CCA tRNA nucleotidyltransferase [Oscillospiraceae bacterium]